MKIRIKDDSVRFRMTLRELETLAAEGRVECTTRVLGKDGPTGLFRYAVVADPDAEESRLELDAASIAFRLGGADLAAFLQPEREGVYLRREWRDPEGSIHRFIAFVEKDRPASTCDKPEAWIYDEDRGQKSQIRPIPAE